MTVPKHPPALGIGLTRSVPERPEQPELAGQHKEETPSAVKEVGGEDWG